MKKIGLITYTIYAQHFMYNNDKMKITKESKCYQDIFMGNTIKEAFYNYTNACNNTDMTIYSPYTIYNISERKSERATNKLKDAINYFQYHNKNLTKTQEAKIDEIEDILISMDILKSRYADTKED